MTVFCLLMSACGYRFAEKDERTGVIDAVAIGVVENRSLETGIESLVTDALRSEVILNAKGRLSGMDAAKTILSGVVTGVRTRTVSRRGSLSSIERRVTVIVDLRLKDREGRIIWSAPGMSSAVSYDVVADDREQTEANKRRAITLAAQRIAQSAYYRMTSDF